MERRPSRRAAWLTHARAAPTPVPSCDGALVARMEQSRRVKAAKRLGLFVASDVFVDAAFEAVAPLAPPFAGTAAAEMERARRPRAAARLASLSAVDASLEMSPVVSVAGAALADTACARMEQARRPRAVARAEKLRRLNAPRSMLHPEHVGAFAMDADETSDAERAFAEWRTHGGWTADETPEENEKLAMDELESLKASASASRLAPETDPFAALERMLETHLRGPSASSPRAGGSGATSRGGSTRGAGAFMHTSRSRSNLNGHGSSATLEREGSTHRANVVPRRVRCSLEDADVVCRVDDSDEVVERVARDSVEAKIAALAETLERERLSAPPPVSR